MCELTFCSLISREEDVLLGMFLTRIGSIRHDDGTGFLTKNSQWKTHLPANNIINYGEILRSEIYESEEYNPIAFHIRNATRGIAVTQENAHPFIKKHYALMHNGTLEFDDDKSNNDDDSYFNFYNRRQSEEVKLDSDSLKFLNLMDEIREKEPGIDILHVVNKAMEKCSGKFAFIIKEIATGDFYIVRGDTAELWMSEYFLLSEEEEENLEKEKKGPSREPDGYVINTSKETLKEGILQFYTTYQLLHDDYRAFFTNPSLLKKETMYKAAPNKLVEIGEVKEKKIIKSYTTYYSRNQNSAIVPASSTKIDEDIESAVSLAKEVSSWIKDNSLTPADFQLIVGFLFGTSLLELTEEDVKMFLTQISPAILSTAPRKFRKHVKKILNGLPFPRYLYEKFNLEFPWMVNDKEKVIKALDFYIKAK